MKSLVKALDKTEIVEKKIDKKDFQVYALRDTNRFFVLVGVKRQQGKMEFIKI